MSQQNKEKWLQSTHTLYQNVISQLIKKIKDQANENAINIQEHHVQQIKELWQQKFEEKCNSNNKQKQQTAQPGEEVLLKKRKADTDLSIEELKKQIQTSDMDYPKLQKVMSDVDIDVNIPEAKPLHKQESQNVFNMFGKQDDEDEDDEDEDEEQKQKERQVLEEKNNLRRIELEKQKMEQLSQIVQDGKDEAEKEKQENIQQEEIHFKKFLNPNINTFQEDTDEEDEDSDDRLLKEEMKSYMTENVLFGYYDSLKDSAKKWSLKLGNMVMQLNGGEEIFVSSLKVDLEFNNN